MIHFKKLMDEQKEVKIFRFCDTSLLKEATFQQRRRNCKRAISIK